MAKEGLTNAIQCDFVILHFLRSKSKKSAVFRHSLHLGRDLYLYIRVHKDPLDIYLLGQHALGVFLKIFFPVVNLFFQFTL